MTKPMSEPSSQYKETIFLPDTTFPMRGNLAQNEPIRLKQWEEAGVYQQIVEKRKAEGAPKFILHDGPPFANGDAHMGTALNKVLKDFVKDPGTVSPLEGLDRVRLETATEDSIAQLNERERNILRWRFGMKGEQDHTLEEIGEKLGLSRERVRQLEARAIEKLRHSSKQRLLEAFAEL